MKNNHKLIYTHTYIYIGLSTHNFMTICDLLTSETLIVG
jgi:hypothetical protein